MPNLYLTEPGSMLEKEAGQLLVTQRGEVLLAIPATRVDQVIIAGRVGVTTPALGFLLDRKIGLVILTQGGVYRGRLQAEYAGDLAIRRIQYQRSSDDSWRLAFARAIIAGKIANSRVLIMRLDKANDNPVAAQSISMMLKTIHRLGSATTRQALMGFEGDAARAGFRALREFIQPPWSFPARARRPPPDPVNALLSLLYTFLHENCRTALQVVGLDPECGFLHEPRPGRSSLALDLMEEFRSVIAESVMLTLLNKRMLSPSDFEAAPEGGVQLTRAGWKIVALQYGKRLQQRIRPDGLSRAISYQKVLEVQARALKRSVMEDAPYEPFHAR